MVETAIHSSIPTAVGMTAARMVHLRLFVSFRMVRRVVEQGQWFKKNSMTHTAVTQVQPFAVRSACISDRLVGGGKVP